MPHYRAGPRVLHSTLYIERNDVELEVQISGHFSPGEPMCRGDSWINYGRGPAPSPGYPPTVEDITARHEGKEIELTEKELEQAEEALMEEMRD